MTRRRAPGSHRLSSRRRQIARGPSPKKEALTNRQAVSVGLSYSDQLSRSVAAQMLNQVSGSESYHRQLRKKDAAVNRVSEARPSGRAAFAREDCGERRARALSLLTCRLLTPF